MSKELNLKDTRFVMYAGDDNGWFYTNRVYYVKTENDKKVVIGENGGRFDLVGTFAESFDPISPDEYFEHRKRSAKRRYKNLNPGDVLELPTGKTITLHENWNKVYDAEFSYDTTTDEFMYYSIPVYKKGRWTKKVK